MKLLVTRPEPQASRLAEALTQAGFTSLVQPLLAIEALAPVTELPKADWLIAVSVHAVARLPRPLPADLKYGAVGEATAQALREAGAPEVLVAEPPTSEGLLALPELQELAGQKVLLAKGEGGRELIQQQLADRGAEVEPLVLYRRRPLSLPEYCAARWRQAGVDRLLLTSGSLMAALLAAVPDKEQHWLKSLPVLVPSKRLADQAKAAGFSHIQLMQDASDQAVIAKLRESQNTMTQDDKLKDAKPKAADETKPAKAESKGAGPARPQADKPEQAGKPGRLLPALALLLALAALGGSGWLYSQFQAAQAELAGLQQRLDGHSHPKPPELGRLIETQGALDEALARQQASLEALRSQWLANQADQAQQWPRQEAAMLVRMANRQLYLARDPDTAQALLSDAERALAKLPEEADILAWRQAVAADLALLAALPRVDRSGLALRLGGLMEQVAKLPLDMVKLPEVTEAEPDLTLSEDVGDWWDNAAKTWQRFADEYLKIRKRQGGVQPLLSPDQISYLQQNMRLALGEARLAVFAGDSDRYQAGLRQLQDWSRDYGDQDSDAVQAFQAELEALLKLPVQVALPARLDSLRVTEEVGA
ncbi:uroporphyrinogen-III C-methyltransferase [Gallaecimonas sp. GXIMD4217]|uniref:uroporphyrinogen-III C-methyltransferase n=1 Tax=Gallaecimonas sp. GXIMD4217 TaxID=3131927 RepID=UPI00311B34A0